MGYLFCYIALFAGATKGYCGKRMSNVATNTTAASLLNLVRMALCVVLGVLLILVQNHIEFFTISPKVLWISALSGITTSVFVVSWLICVRYSAYMMLDVFLMLGTLVPMLLGRAIFNETIRLNQWIGFIVLVLATIIMVSYNNNIKNKLNLSSTLLLIICGVSNGLTSFSQKSFVKMLPELPISIFNFYTYLFAAITLFIFILFMSKKEKPEFAEGSKNKFFYVIIMAIALTVNTYFSTMAAIHLDSAILYPLNHGLALIIASFMSVVFYKEKLTVKAIIGIILSFIGLLIMNVL